MKRICALFLVGAVSVFTACKDKKNEQPRVKGVILGDKIYLRAGPKSSASIIAVLNSGDQISISDGPGKGAEMEYIAGNSDYWYQVETGGKTGFVFGAYLFDNAKLYGGWISGEIADVRPIIEFQEKGNYLYLVQSALGPDAQNPRIEGRGTFSVKGREIIFDPPVRDTRYFLFRYKGENLITNTEYRVGDASFAEKYSAGHGDWWIVKR